MCFVATLTSISGRDVHKYKSGADVLTFSDFVRSHEWRKHGTCAMSVDFLNDEHDYFKEALKIRKSLDIYK